MAASIHSEERGEEAQQRGRRKGTVMEIMRASIAASPLHPPLHVLDSCPPNVRSLSICDAHLVARPHAVV